MKHRKKIFALVLSLLTVISLTSCKDSSGIEFDSEGLTTVTYKINSGYVPSDTGNPKEIKDVKFGNSLCDVIYYYDLKTGKSCNVVDISEFSSIRELQVPSGVILDGWYKDSEYKEEWDFETDILKDGENLVLYPKWSNRIQHHYVVGYQDGEEFKKIYEYKTNEGDSFSDYLGKIATGANSQKITWLGHLYLDKDLKNPVTSDYKHPGGEEETNIPIYIDYIKGIYTLVSTYDELVKVAKSNKNIYLMNDIDCEGNALSFGNYKGSKTLGNLSFIGNNHTISNFSVSYDTNNKGINIYDNSYFDSISDTKNTLGISLFGDSSYVDFSDVSFKDFKINVSCVNDSFKYCVISPFAYKLTNSSLTNVKMENCEITVSKLKLSDRIKGKYRVIYNYNEEKNEKTRYFYNDEGVLLEEETKTNVALLDSGLVMICNNVFSNSLDGTKINNSSISNIYLK